MSKYESETGTISFTKTGYPKAVALVRKSYNDYINELFEITMKAYNKLAQIKGAGAKNKRLEMAGSFLSFDFNRGVLGEYSSGCVPFIKVYDKGFQCMDEHQTLFTKELFRGKDNALTKPRRSAFVTLKNTQRSFFIECGEEQSGMTFDEKSLSFKWNICENNHAVRDAHNSVGFKLIVAALNEYKWGRDEGGIFTYSDDERDDDGERISFPEISCRFGQRGDKLASQAADARNRMFRAMC
jgi:hypothetical protein